MAEPAGYVPICDLDWSDMTLYQHPPCMFTLWWLGLFVNAIWDPIKEAIEGLLSGGDGGEGDEGEGEGEGGGEEGGDEGGGEEQEGEEAGGEEKAEEEEEGDEG